MIPRTLLSLLLAASLTLSSCRTEVQTDATTSTAAEATSTSSEMQLATFGSGCFWCGEAIFEQLRGVSNVQSGYSGGHVNNPTYRQICGKRTGHAEVFQVSFDPRLITYTDLLEVFWKTHDPTTLNSQGNDHGPQYRSVIFHHSDSQKQTASSYLKKLDASGAFPHSHRHRDHSIQEALASRARTPGLLPPQRKRRVLSSCDRPQTSEVSGCLLRENQKLNCCTPAATELRIISQSDARQGNQPSSPSIANSSPWGRNASMMN